MTLENQTTDCKSLRTVSGKTANWDEVAKDCVCFANGQGGRLLIGIEDNDTHPPIGQVIPSALLDQLRKRIGELTQRERITLGVLAQTEGMTARELSAMLETEAADGLAIWLGRLVQCGLVLTSGKTSGMRYFVASDWLRGAQLDQKTTLSRITPHRLQALILEDLARYPGSSSADINRRIGAEISAKTVKRALDDLVGTMQVAFEGDRRWRRYRLI